MFKTTDRSLVSGMERFDEEKWREFVTCYTKPIASFAKNCLSLSANDLEELTEEVIQRLFIAMTSGRFTYDRTNGGLRYYLQEMARRVQKELMRDSLKWAAVLKPYDLDVLPALIERQHEKLLEQKVLTKLNSYYKGTKEEKKWAIYKDAITSTSQQAADKHGMSFNQVKKIRQTFLPKIQQRVQQLEKDWDEQSSF